MSVLTITFCKMKKHNKGFYVKIYIQCIACACTVQSADSLLYDIKELFNNVTELQNSLMKHCRFTLFYETLRKSFNDVSKFLYVSKQMYFIY